MNSLCKFGVYTKPIKKPDLPHAIQADDMAGKTIVYFNPRGPANSGNATDNAGIMSKLIMNKLEVILKVATCNPLPVVLFSNLCQINLRGPAFAEICIKKCVIH